MTGFLAFWRSETEVRGRIQENMSEYFWRDILTGPWRFGGPRQRSGRRILENMSEYFWRDFLTGSSAFWRSETEVRENTIKSSTACIRMGSGRSG